MSKTIKPHLGEVQQTLMIPLYGRALDTTRGIMNDSKAVEMVKSIDYDFGKIKAKAALRVASLRTLSYDHLLGELLERHPEAVVVELGCGLNTRYERLNDPNRRWYDLDMPDVYEIWKGFFSELENRNFLPYSAFDTSWLNKIKKRNDETIIFISEASTIYFDEAENKKLFLNLANAFPNGYIIFDTATDYFLSRQDKNPLLKNFSARLKWCVNDPKDIESWNPGFKLLRQVNFFANAPESVKKLIPWYWKIMGKLMMSFNKRAANQYQLNVLSFGK